MGFSSHEWPLMCCICFEGLTAETAAQDSTGQRWDVCQDSRCVEAAGLENREFNENKR